MERVILDPSTETDVTIREAPFEQPGGGVSRRLKSWIFYDDSGRYICAVPMHRSLSLTDTPEHELEEVYLLALRNR